MNVDIVGIKDVEDRVDRRESCEIDRWEFCGLVVGVVVNRQYSKRQRLSNFYTYCFVD